MIFHLKKILTSPGAQKDKSLHEAFSQHET